MDKTHYRKAFDSPYLSAADIVEATQFTILRVTLEIDHTKKTKDMFNTAYFAEKEIRPGEKLKPMILNAHNSKFMAKVTGSKYIDDWLNVPVLVYVEDNIKFGRDIVEGLRLAPARAIKKVLTPSNSIQWDQAKAAYKRDGNLNAVLKRMDISETDQATLIAECTENVA